MPIGGGEPMGRQFDFFGGEETQHNVFFAAVPDAATSASAGEVAREARQRLGLSGAPVSPERHHVSLLSVGGFSGSCPPAVITAAMRVASTVSMAPFDVAFDRVASFAGGLGKRALVLTGGEDGVAGFVTLRKALSQAMMRAGLRLPRQSGGSPHMTLMYDERVCDFPIPPIDWTVRRFVLVDSLVGQSRHVRLGQWLL